jgi:hypothetical protein
MLLFHIALGVAFSGNAGDVAEGNRLTAEITRLAERTVWSGVERNYAKLLKVKRYDIPPATHLIAAQAAQERGDIRTASMRVERAMAAASEDPDALQKASEWWADFMVNYGQARIELSVAFRSDPIVHSRDPVFAPKVRTILDFASKQLMSERVFDGYLPIGRYRIGAEDFDIAGERVEVFVRPLKDDDPVDLTSPAAEVGERTVVLAARSPGWRVAEWDLLSTRVRDALYAVDGVESIDVAVPSHPWVLVTPRTDDMASNGLTVVEVASRLQESLEGSDVVYDTTMLAVTPGPTPQAVADVVVREPPEPEPVEDEDEDEDEDEAEPSAASEPSADDSTPWDVPDEAEDEAEDESPAPSAPSDSSDEPDAAEPVPPLRLQDVADVRIGVPDLPVPADMSRPARYRFEVRTTAATDLLLEAANAAEGASRLGLRPEAPEAP